ncbi:hypothetical protein [Nocardioides montaniterrae]
MAKRRMMTTADGYECRHVSIANPKGKHETDLPRLLRTVAELIEELAIKPMELMDVVIRSEITGDGPRWSATIYWARDASPSGE